MLGIYRKNRNIGERSKDNKNYRECMMDFTCLCNAKFIKQYLLKYTFLKSLAIAAVI